MATGHNSTDPGTSSDSSFSDAPSEIADSISINDLHYHPKVS